MSENEKAIREELKAELQGWLEKVETSKDIYEDSKEEITKIKELLKLHKKDKKDEVKRNKKMCEYYKICTRTRPLYNRTTGLHEDDYEEVYGVCLGTRERDEVDCKGDKHSNKCPYNDNKE